MRPHRPVALLLFIVVGCGGGAVRLRDTEISQRADANLLRAQSELQGRTVIVSGRVDSTRLVARTASSSTWIPTGTNGVPIPITSEWSERVPVVVLGPDHRVQCFFDEGDAARVSAIAPGRHITLKCSFDHYISKTGVSPIAVLTDCDLAP